MKENNGRAARRRSIKNGVVGAAVLLTGVLAWNFSGGRGSGLANIRIRKNGGGFRSSLRPGDGEELILQGKAHLIQLSIPSRALSAKNAEFYKGVKGVFCPLDWELQKRDPSSVPMFKDLVHQSKNCERNRVTVDFLSIVRKARELETGWVGQADEGTGDEGIKNQNSVHAVAPTGFVFHETRCGSTLVANILAAMDPQRSRVYSESTPPIQALRACDEERSEPGSCDDSKAAALLRDAVYMMGRTDNPDESRLFFKVQSVGVRNIGVFRKAFPETPWLFVFRDSVQVMMSHFKGGTKNSAVCLRSRKKPPKILKDIVEKVGRQVTSLSKEEFCAAHLASLCESAIKEHRASGTGMVINYEDIPGKLMDSILPHYFKVPVGMSERARIESVCEKYSKGRGKKKNVQWKDDSHNKEETASPEVQKACNTFLGRSFDTLQTIAATEEK